MILPVAGALGPAKLAIVAELNGRFPSLRPGTDATIPSIHLRFNEATAPGLTQQTAYLQPSEGLRIEPALFKDHIRLNYLTCNFSSSCRAFQQRLFVPPLDAGDFSHEIPLYQLFGSKLMARSRYSPNRSWH